MIGESNNFALVLRHSVEHHSCSVKNRRAECTCIVLFPPVLETMKLLVVMATLYCLVPAPVEAAQQCVECTSSDCYESTLKTESCNEKCYTIHLRKDSPDEKKPFTVKGCTSDSLFYRRSCANKCYDKKKEFGSSMYYMCVYCCTGDKCNSGSQLKGGIMLTTVSATLVLMKYLYF